MKGSLQAKKIVGIHMLHVADSYILKLEGFPRAFTVFLVAITFPVFHLFVNM